jgi:hypothetical protein
VHQDGVTRGHAEQVEDPLRSLAGDRQSGRLVPAHRLGLAGGDGRQGVPGIGSGVGEPEHLVTGSQCGDALTDRVDDTGRLDAGSRRERGREHLLQPAVADLVVERVDPGRHHTQPDLAGAGFGKPGLRDAQHLGPTEPVEDDRLHDCHLSRGSSWHQSAAAGTGCGADLFA